MRLSATITDRNSLIFRTFLFQQPWAVGRCNSERAQESTWKHWAITRNSHGQQPGSYGRQRGGWLLRLGFDQRLTRGIGWESAAFKSCRNKSISDGVSIRGIFEVTSFRPGKAVEAEFECLPPPVFKVLSMLLS